uniref:uncharacterized protein LOC114582561 isoform X2 n=1 Tax=Podarcis muralis TaxID=64176 RepID=UPI0010A02A1E|nr:uncharacterized protein LOC114582561 isoform X2 [Podarcis muralis]
MKSKITSRRFPAGKPRTSSPLPLLCTGMAPSRPCWPQKQQPKFPPIKTASQVISEREGTLVSASVLGRSGRIPDARTEEYRLGQLIRSGREPFPNIYFVLVKSLERCDDPQGHTSKDEAPAPAPGTKNDRPSRWFPAPDPCLPPPPSVLRVGMAPSRPYLAQKEEPRFPPIKNTSRVIPEPGETWVAASVPSRPGRSPDTRTEEFRLGQLIRSARRRFSLGAAASWEGLEPRQRPLTPEVLGQREGQRPPLGGKVWKGSEFRERGDFGCGVCARLAGTEPRRPYGGGQVGAADKISEGKVQSGNCRIPGGTGAQTKASCLRGSPFSITVAPAEAPCVKRTDKRKEKIAWSWENTLQVECQQRMEEQPSCMRAERRCSRPEGHASREWFPLPAPKLMDTERNSVFRGIPVLTFWIVLSFQVAGGIHATQRLTCLLGCHACCLNVPVPDERRRASLA